MKQLIIADFDNTLFSLEVDWASLKTKINQLLTLHQLESIESGLYHNLNQINLSTNRSELITKIDRLITRAEQTGIKNGSKLPLFDQLINSKPSLDIIVYTQNSTQVVNKFVQEQTASKPFVIGRQPLDFKPKDDIHMIQRLVNQINNNYRQHELYYVGDKPIDAKVADTIKAKFFLVDQKSSVIDRKPLKISRS